VTWVDHLLTAIILAVAPFSAMWNMARFVRAVESGRPDARIHGYLWTIASQWAVTLTLLFYWIRQPRDLDALGLVWPTGPALWISVLMSAAAVAFMTRQTFATARSADSQAKMREQLAGKVAVLTLLPRTAGEVRAFTALGVTAGICEEILYRGFLLWYVAHFADRPVAAIIAVLAFAGSHAYQGMTGVIQAVVFASIAIALYLLTGSLLAPMVLHGALDVGSGRTARHALGAPSV
jgi:membrane protease YdiL (CAAX protease family)